MIRREDGGVDVITTQTLRADRLPGVVTQFHRGDLSFVREEAWTPVRRGGAAAPREGHHPRRARHADRHRGADAPSGDGARLEFKATVEVRIPLVGGKVENFIGSQLVDLLIAEQRFTTAWISKTLKPNCYTDFMSPASRRLILSQHHAGGVDQGNRHRPP